MSTSSGQRQHVDEHSKVLLRRQLLRFAPGIEGSAYVPFIGDGDLAVELYTDFDVWGADLDPDRVRTAMDRLPEERSNLAVGDCDAWPFMRAGDRVVPVASRPFVVADFDAYLYPYAGFRSFVEAVPPDRIGDRLVVAFTDGQLQSVKRNSFYRHPDGEDVRLPDVAAMRRIFNGYWSRVIRPWWLETCARLGWQSVVTRYYTRSGNMLYWGAVARPRHD